jgi:4,5-dihydroxyphthalate decarboxylase
MSSKAPISFACGLYDRMQALHTGEVKPEGVDLNFIVHNHPRDVFDRMMGGREFDASEMSCSEYICRYAAGERNFVAIPVFPSRAFRHSFIAVNDRTVKKPVDLNGKKIGVQLYTMTAAVWIRGLLKQCGVDLSSVEWVEGSMEGPEPHGKPTVLPLLKPVSITNNMSGKSLSQLLEDGEIDATIGADLPPCFGKAPHVKRLFPDFKEAEKKYYRDYGIFPIMHTVVIKREIHEKYPFVATSLFNALNDSKNIAYKRMRFLDALRYMLPWLPSEIDEIDEVFKGDPWPYGVDPNRKTLEALVECLYDQSMIEKKVTVDELFLQHRGQNWKVGWGPTQVAR